MHKFRNLQPGVFFVVVDDTPSRLLMLDIHGKVYGVELGKRQAVKYREYEKPIPLEATVQPFDWSSLLADWTNTTHHFHKTESHQ